MPGWRQGWQKKNGSRRIWDAWLIVDYYYDSLESRIQCGVKVSEYRTKCIAVLSTDCDQIFNIWVRLKFKLDDENLIWIWNAIKYCGLKYRVNQWQRIATLMLLLHRHRHAENDDEIWPIRFTRPSITIGPVFPYISQHHTLEYTIVRVWYALSNMVTSPQLV